MRKFIVLMILLFCAGSLLAQDLPLEEHFADGTLALDWFSPWGDWGENLEPVEDATAPDGDGWIGSLSNGFNDSVVVGTSVAGSLDLDDYMIEAWMFALVNTNTRNGIIARLDTTSGMNSYYYVWSNFNSGMGSTPNLALRYYDGASAHELLRWENDTLPGGTPDASDWQKVGLSCEGDQLNVYWNDVLCPGCPVTHTELTNGFFGVYTFDFMDEATTLVDSIVVTRTGIDWVEPGSNTVQPETYTIISNYPNPFNPATTITVDSPGLFNATLSVYDLLGRRVSEIVQGNIHSGMLQFGFDGSNLPSGEYFVILQTPEVKKAHRIVLLK